MISTAVDDDNDDDDEQRKVAVPVVFLSFIKIII